LSACVTQGEEMTKYTMELVMERWINKYMDTSAWDTYDLSCKARDESEDKVLHDAVAAGAAIGAIFKEPTITPTAVQQKEMGLKKAWGSPNGAMRRGIESKCFVCAFIETAGFFLLVRGS
jgi:isocitrate dehydrogenase